MVVRVNMQQVLEDLKKEGLESQRLITRRIEEFYDHATGVKRHF